MFIWTFENLEFENKRKERVGGGGVNLFDEIHAENLPELMKDINKAI